MPAGAAYVYLNYGMYWLFNLLVKGGPRDGLILIRALEPKEGITQMQTRRGKQLLHDLCSGPGKLAMALGITGADHATPLAGCDRAADVGLCRKANAHPSDIVADVRVGISKAVEHPWRFLYAGNRHVSVPFGKVKVPQAQPRDAVAGRASAKKFVEEVPHSRP